MRGIPDFIDANIDVDTVVRYMNMTPKKPPVDSIDKLIESGNIPAILSKYVELTLDANKLKECLLANPDIAQALSGLVSRSTPIQTPPVISPWQAMERTGGSPQATMQLMGNDNAGIVPGVAEPLGTIHKEVPASYDFPMDEYTQAGAQSQDAVMSLLQGYQQGNQQQGYQQLDPSGEQV